jgi:hypothetical protein
MHEQSFNTQPTARKSLFDSQLGSASRNPHQLGFEFDKGHVDASRKVIMSRLPRFDYEHEHRPLRRTEHEHGEQQT